MSESSPNACLRISENMQIDKRKTVMKKRLALLLIAIVLLAGLIFAGLYCGIIQLNQPSAEVYPVRGVDVSHYQGSIDWDALQTQGICFAFIKATEGSSHVDGNFQSNWDNIARTDLRAGAYHFFSFESSGSTQAENFIRTVCAVEHMLPPVVDVEPYGDFKTLNDIPDAIDEMRVWLRAIEAEYGMKPIIYTSVKFYEEGIGAEFSDYDIWIRSVYRKPSPFIRWIFWQYADRMRLHGYDGSERFIDMNVFHGSMEEFSAYPQ